MEILLIIIGAVIGFVAFNKNIPGPPPEEAVGDAKLNGTASVAMKLGYMALSAWLIPLFGLPIAVAGLILASRGTGSQYDGVSKANIHCAIGLILTVINGWIGMMM